MVHAWNILAQAAPAAAVPQDDWRPFTGSPVHFSWRQWAEVAGWHDWLFAASTLLLILVLGFLLSRVFRRLLHKYQLMRAVRWGNFTLAVYATLIAFHPARMTDPYDLLALTFHKLFIAIVLLVVLRFIDRLIVIPVLTRGGRVGLSRFVHQIVVAVLAFLLLAGYCHWAFEVDISSLLAGSAVISIVLGLALQETLGNFFSGMVLQASVPFAPGDWIIIGEGPTAVEGRVVEMTWRAVTLLGSSNSNILIPNSVVARTRIVNFHAPAPATIISLPFNLPGELDPQEARRVLLLAASDAAGIAANPPPAVAITSYNVNSITYTLSFSISEPARHGAIEAAVRWNAWYRLRQAGIRPVEAGVTPSRLPPEVGREARLKAIKNSPLFSTMGAELQQQLAAETTDFQLAAGQLFFRQGDPGDVMFLVLAGSVQITMQASDGREIDLGETGEGGIFGEFSALTGRPRTGTVRAKTNVQVMQISRQHLQELLAHDPELAKHMSQVVAERQVQREALLEKVGAAGEHAAHDSQAHSILALMKPFLNLIHH